MHNIKARIKAVATRAKGVVRSTISSDKPENATSDRLESDVKRCRRLMDSHQRLSSLFAQFAETSRQHTEIGTIQLLLYRETTNHRFEDTE